MTFKVTCRVLFKVPLIFITAKVVLEVLGLFKTNKATPARNNEIFLFVSSI